MVENLGQTVGLYVRETVLASVARDIAERRTPARVVLQHEKSRKVPREASKEWLLGGTVKGRRQGELAADANGKIL